MATVLDVDWYELADPETGIPFFANPKTGECLKKLPSNAKVKPLNPDGDWWELFDHKHNLPYYFHTKTKQVEWTKPSHGVILPLKNVQENLGKATLPKNPSSVTMLNEKTETVTRSRTLPRNLQDDINKFQIDGFASKYFATHKRGIFRRKVPMQKMLEFTAKDINAPLIIMKSDHFKDAIKCFKEIQRIMGDRPGTISKTAKDVNNEDYQFLLEKGVFQGELRDELYVQLCKQLTNNPSSESVFKGWELMCTFCGTFPPSKNFEDYLMSFIRKHEFHRDEKTVVMASFCERKLERICRTGPRGKTPTFAEIDRAKSAPFNPSVFGETLEDIMKMKNSVDSNGKYPKILPFLAEAVLRLNGTATEGIFRVPGDADSITELKLRIESGNYDLGGITDPNIPASLLKFWLRDLADPLVPAHLYDLCIKDCENAEKAVDVLQQLPQVNREVAIYMINFLQIVADPKYQPVTKMSVNNLSMVFAPNFLRCPSDNPQVIFENTKYEQSFLRTLIINYK